VAHEISNPLAGIDTSAQVLLRRDSSPRDERARFVRVILDEVARLNRIVDSLSNTRARVSRSSSRTRSPPCIEHVLVLAADPVERAGVRVELDVAPRLGPVYIDPDLVTQVLLNVTSNAVQAMPQGGRLRYEVRRVPGGADLREARAVELRTVGRVRPSSAQRPWSFLQQVRVIDTGVGIPRGCLAKLFDPFFSTKPGGTGSVFSICQTIMHEHGGSIAAASREGEGPPCCSTSRWRSAMAKGEEQTQTQSAQGLLIVDDERSLRFSLGEWARDIGLRPVEARVGWTRSPRSPGRRRSPFCLDLKLGEEDGLQVLKRLREGRSATAGDHAHRPRHRGARGRAPPSSAPTTSSSSLPISSTSGSWCSARIEHARAAPRGRSPAPRPRIPSSPCSGQSAGLKEAVQQLDRVAASPRHHRVLLLGETGTGKELMARHLHAHSCARRGSFHRHQLQRDSRAAARESALRTREGRVHRRQALQEGTRSSSRTVAPCFSTRSARCRPALQAKLLRVLEGRTFRRVGGHADIAVDVRVVAATHRDSRQMMAKRDVP
jgi:hypothetical protein